MLLRLRILCLLGGVILFMPLFALPPFLLKVILCIIGLLVVWISYSAHKQSALLIRSYKELKEQPSKKNTYV